MEAPVVEGYLTKRGDIVKNWKKRWFRFEGDRLYYYKRKGDTKSLGYIPLGFGCSVVKFDRDEKAGVAEPELSPRCGASSSPAVKNVCAFRIITKKRTFLLEAESKEDMRAWVKRLQAVLQYVFQKNTQTPFAAVSLPNAVTPKGCRRQGHDTSPSSPSPPGSVDSSPGSDCGTPGAPGQRHSRRQTSAQCVAQEEVEEPCLGVHNNSTSEMICALESDLVKDKRHTIALSAAPLDSLAVKERLNAAAAKVDNFQRTTNAKISALEYELEEAKAARAMAEDRADRLEAIIARDKASSSYTTEMEVLRSRNRVFDDELDSLRQQLAIRDNQIEELQREAEEKNFLLLQQAKNRTAVPTPTGSRLPMDRATSREQLVERVADLERRLGKAKAGMMAQQTHTAFLNSEVERLEKEKSALQSSQSASSQDWKSEVSEYRKAYQHIKRKYEIMCTKFGVHDAELPQLDAEQRQLTTEAEKLKFLTERYFMSYVAACKLRKVVKGQLCDINSRQLFERAMAEQVPISRFETWIKDQVQANVAGLAAK